MVVLQIIKNKNISADQIIKKLNTNGVGRKLWKPINMLNLIKKQFM